MASNNATRITASIFGIMTGLYGIEHGYFETLQGNVAPSGIVINAVSSPCLPYPFGCEPAMTVVPNLFVTGIIAIIISVIVTIWSAAFVQRKKGGAVLILLSIVQLLVGGGLAAVFSGIIGGVAGTKINSSFTLWRMHLTGGTRKLLSNSWIYFLIVSLLWVPVEFILGYFFGANNQALAALPNIPIPVVLFVLTVLCGFAYDVERTDRFIALQHEKMPTHTVSA